MTDETHLPMTQGVGANQVATTAGGQLPQFRERHTIIEKKQVDREALSDIGRHLLSVTAAVNAYAIEKGSLILAIYGSQAGEGASIAARELAVSVCRSPTNTVLLVDGNTGPSDQSKHFKLNGSETLWAAARGAPIRTIRLMVPRGGAFDLAALPIDGASDP